MTKTKLLFFGSHVRSGECLRYVLETMPTVEVVGLALNKSETGDYDQQPMREIADKHGIPILSLQNVSTLHYDLGISILYDRKLPPAIVDRPPRGLINLHLGPLPRYRGVNSIYHAIRRARPDNDWMFGITLHYIDHGLDTGPIIDIMHIPILEDDTAYDLYLRATRKIRELFVRNIGRLVDSSERVPSSPQKGPSFYFKRTDIELEVNLKASPNEIYDAIRALTFPGKSKPFAFVGKRKIYLSLDQRS